MPWDAKQTPNYAHMRRRLSPGVLKALNKVQSQLIHDPRRGDRKRPPLEWVWVEKFKAENAQWLVAYEIRDREDILVFHAVGQHENFYRDLTKHVKRGGGKISNPLP